MGDPVSSEAVRVTLFEDRAEVVRRATCAVPAGVSWVAVAGVTPALDDPSLVAGVVGDGARVIATRVVRAIVPVSAAGDDERDAAERDATEADARRTAADRGEHRATAELERLDATTLDWVSGVSAVPRGTADDPAAGARAWREAFDAIEAAAGAAEEGVLAAEEQCFEARADQLRAHARLEAARATRSLRTSRVEVQVEAPEAREVTIELTYRTPCALWRPEHLARWTPPGDGEPSTVTITTAAVIWQATGEVWSNVTARFSTARPAQSAAPPLLTDDVLTTRRKSDPERSRVVVEAREQAIATAGLARGTRDVDEMPGVDDGGEAQWFEGAHPVTIPSDGEAHRVELTRASITAEVERVAWPERGDAVHLRATATLVGEAPLLAGPVVLARGGELVGRGRVDFVGRGEPFELGFGVDDGLRVRRSVDEKRDTTPVIGTQKVARTVRVYLSNLSDEARRLTVIERYPVSEVDEVKVAVVSHEDATLDARDGFAKWVVTLGAGSTRTLTLVYRIEAAAKVVLPPG
ncbi:MAG: mucoidy inhibitor MuiA family protein [Myxococcales bacterium]|nr:mucoidy inhibitor MuiA family protein [Myxococcales bacterium]